MPHYSKTSEAKLVTAHPDLQTLFRYVIRYFDNTILYGYRSPEEQFELFKKGRKEVNGKWVIDDSTQIVTWKDGYERKSKHNYMPSHAIDAVPYPINWKDMNRMRYFAGFVKGIAQMLYEFGTIEHEIVSGIDWDNDTDLNDQRFLDVPHFQIK